MGKANITDIDYKLRLIIRLDNGRVLSGVYPWLAAMARQKAAQGWPQCVEAWTEEA